ncbi:MAG: dephospho-CoA kinase [Treponema sp.]|nr:dephospho-CoA kinase [Treponema sp.]
MIICLTGFMASGKNAVATILEKYGWKTLDADTLVHKAIEIEKEKIVNTFLPYAKNENLTLVNENGQINRRAIGTLVFKNKALLKKQENIVYPKVVELTNDFVKENADFNIALNATVLYKTPSLINICQKIIFVTSPFFTRLKRAKKRDNLSLFQILHRFKNQRTLFKEYKKCNIPMQVINNDSTLEKLERKTLAWLKSASAL